jgi:hypothetical protein
MRLADFAGVCLLLCLPMCRCSEEEKKPVEVNAVAENTASAQRSGPRPLDRVSDWREEPVLTPEEQQILEEEEEALEDQPIVETETASTTEALEDSYRPTDVWNDPTYYRDTFAEPDALEDIPVEDPTIEE